MRQFSHTDAPRVISVISVDTTPVFLGKDVNRPEGCGLYGVVAGGTAAWLKFYAKVTAPTAADTPVLRLQVGANGLNRVSDLPLLSTSTSLWCRITTGATDADNVNVAGCVVNFFVNRS